MTTTKYIWDEQNYLAEANANDTINVIYTNEPQLYGTLVSSRLSGATSYHFFDALGSTRQLTNTAGTVTDTWVYDTWGNVLSRTGLTLAAAIWIGERGYYTDREIGLLYVRRRLYSPLTARWTSYDPSALVPQLRDLRMHLLGYLYASNNPIRVTDASGLDPATDSATCSATCRAGFCIVYSNGQPPECLPPGTNQRIIDLKLQASGDPNARVVKVGPAPGPPPNLPKEPLGIPPSFLPDSCNACQVAVGDKCIPNNTLIAKHRNDYADCSANAVATFAGRLGAARDAYDTCRAGYPDEVDKVCTEFCSIGGLMDPNTIYFEHCFINCQEYYRAAVFNPPYRFGCYLAYVAAQVWVYLEHSGDLSKCSHDSPCWSY